MGPACAKNHVVRKEDTVAWRFGAMSVRMARGAAWVHAVPRGDKSGWIQPAMSPLVFPVAAA